MKAEFELQGHRGARGLFPENTVEGFRAAAGLGVRWFEIDVGVTRDEVVVVHHDLALNPEIASLDGRWLAGSLPLLKDLTFDELQDFEVGRIRPGSDYAARYPDQVAIEGARVPSLAAVLAVGDELGWNIELKLMPDRPNWTVSPEEMVERVLAVVDAADAAGRVTLQSFDWRAPRYARRVRPEVKRGWLTRAETIGDAGSWWGREHASSVPLAIAEEGGGTWTPYWEELTPELLDEAQGVGLAVIPWTVNDGAAMARLVAWGVDGLITDRPDLFSSVRSAA